MADSPLKQKADLVSFSIMVNGSEIPGTMAVTELEVKKEVNRIPTASITIVDGNWAEMDFAASSKDTFKPGSEIKITLGYHQQEEPVFEGIVVTHGIRIPDDGVPTLIVKCADKAAKMTAERKNKYFMDTKDSDVMSSLIGEHGLSADVKSTSVQHERIVQYQCSDWDLLVTRAELNGLIVVVDDGKVAVKAPETSNDVLSLTMGSDIKRLEIDVDARYQVPKVSTEGWNFSTNAIDHSDASEPSVPATGNLTGKQMAEVLGASDYRLHSSAPIPPDELKAWADGKLMRARYSLIRGKIAFLGHAAPKPDTTVALSGLGTRFNGSAYVSGVYHRVKDQNWETEVTIGMSAQMYAETQKDIELPVASGMLPAVHGLHLGTVQKIDEDVQGELRILVDVPVIVPSGDGIWARLATYYATKDAGNHFYPEIGDEVVLGFVNDDPRFPIVVGSVYGKTHMSKYTPDSPNTYKAIVTNSKMKIEFEDVKRIITIWTPNGNYIEINDDKQSITIEDETANKMVMDPKGITWHTPKDFKLTADGLIDIKATKTITMEATQDFSIKGLNVKSEASVAISMKGATAEVNGSGQTTIKGGMVMIN